ncbi:MAG: hypothetical protein ACYTGZ_19055 [Planctomycetota bacterium]|jgi:hypothetical protein
MKTSSRPELKEPVLAFARRLAAGEEFIPLADLAALFGAGGELMETVGSRGQIRFFDGKFTNDGPELVVPAGKVELEIPNLMRGRFTSDGDAFKLSFPSAEFSLRACVRIAIIRKCFDLQEMRATADSLEIDFGNDLANRRYEF